MPAAPPLVVQLVALVVASAVIAYICQRLRMLPIVGFLLTGVALGPNALGLVRDAEFIEAMAEIGVALLLFTLGIEFSLERLARLQRAIFAGGGLQMILAIGVTMTLLALAGVEWRSGFFTGSLVALSSTAIVLKVLADGGISSPRGQLAVGILIFQDLAVVVLVLVVPMLGVGGEWAGIISGVAVALVIVAGVLLAARRLMPPLLERVARTCSQEIFLLTIIAICLGTAWLTSLAGVSLSLGAFLAGLVVSESRFSHHVFAEILPLQILFSAVFFVSVGLLLDLNFAMRNPLLIAAVVGAVLLVKVVTTSASALLLRVPAGVAIGTAFLIAQIGEFSFVLERVGDSAGLHPAGSADAGGQTFIAAAVLLMALTPLLARAGAALERRFEREALPETEPERAAPIDLENHVIVAGYGSAARYLTRVLRDSGVPFVILTLSPTGATEAERDGMKVTLGDYSRRILLENAAIDRAKMLVIPDDAPDMAQRVTAIARSLNPTVRIVVRTLASADVDRLLREGADDVFVDQIEVGVQLFTRVLTEYGVPLQEIEDHAGTVRSGAMSKEEAMRVIALTPEQKTTANCSHVRSVRSEITTSASGCEDCLRIGDTWVHLRICMSCGGVRCCDSSKNRHATRHYQTSQHPVIKSYQPDESWAWCYPDEVTF